MGASRRRVSKWGCAHCSCTHRSTLAWGSNWQRRGWKGREKDRRGLSRRGKLEREREETEGEQFVPDRHSALASTYPGALCSTWVLHFALGRPQPSIGCRLPHTRPHSRAFTPAPPAGSNSVTFTHNNEFSAVGCFQVQMVDCGDTDSWSCAPIAGDVQPPGTGTAAEMRGDAQLVDGNSKCYAWWT
eukprot:49626-Chlamydomonas_euryale.AAC.3